MIKLSTCVKLHRSTSHGQKSLFVCLLLATGLFFNESFAQTCPAAATGIVSIAASPNTYYPGSSGTLAVGAVSIVLGAVPSTTYGTSPIAIGDQLLLIQMQGAQISSSNSIAYGNGTSGSGYTTTNLYAGKMEVVTAASAVPTTGGTLTIAAPGTVNTYANSVYGTFGQYTYQVIRMASAYSIQLTGTIITPPWNGKVGGVTILNAGKNLDFNGQTINASGAGFRGGGGRQLGGLGLITLGFANTDYVTGSGSNLNASKGEGIAGTPRYLNNGGTTVTDNTVEGFPAGSYARGAPGTAGGGGTDGSPGDNSQNSGGAGGGNGGAGGLGGNSWQSNLAIGGLGGSAFTQASSTVLVMGGGGGAGSTNDGTPAGTNGFASSGVAGGGLVIINAGFILGSGTINVSGANGFTTVLNDGSGGAGAGGSVLVLATSGQSGITVNAKGGTGGSNTPGTGVAPHGPGGGGGGGVVLSNATLNAATSVTGGAAGTSFANTTTNFGALAGSNGVLTQTIAITAGPNKIRTCQNIIALPVILNYFEVSNQGDNNLLTWSTASEINFSAFKIERSNDGISFDQIASVPGSSNPNERTDYAYTDALNFTPGNVLYYRLRMVDIDGKYQYSQVVAIHLDQNNREKLMIYPNPTKGSVQIEMVSDKEDLATMRVFDNNGRMQYSGSVPLTKGDNVLPFTQLQNLPNGFYIIQVIMNGKIYNHKLIKQ